MNRRNAHDNRTLEAPSFRVGRPQFTVAFPSAMYYRQKWVDSVYIVHYWEKDAVVALLLALLGVAIMAFGVFPYLPRISLIISP